MRLWLQQVDRFVPSDVDDEVHRRARAVVTLALLIAPWGLIIGGALFAMGEWLPGVVIGAVSVACGGLLAAVVRGWVHLAAHGLVATLVLALTLASILLGGVGSPPTQWLVLGPVIATVTAGSKAGLRWTWGVVAASLGIHAIQAAGGVAEPYLYNGWEVVGTVSLLGLYLLMGVFLYANDALYTRLVERLRRAEAAERRANQAKSDFLANMSHELRTPLNAMLGYTELVAEEVAELDAPGVIGDLQRIGRSGDHLLQLVNDILDLSKIEAGRMELTLEPVELEPLVNATLDALGPVLGARGNTVETELAAVVVSADVVRLQQCLSNLLANAAKFTEGGRITVRVRDDGIEVEDTGIGMTPEQLERVFDPFAQAEATTARQFGGTGLGLAIVERLIVRMGGSIEARSELGRGTCFRLCLPVIETAP